MFSGSYIERINNVLDEDAHDYRQLSSQMWKWGALKVKAQRNHRQHMSKLQIKQVKLKPVEFHSV